MIVHIVMFEFKNENKKQNILKAKELLEGLINQIETLKSIEVGLNFNATSRAMDLSIYTTFETKEDLESYAKHPAHLKVIEFIRETTSHTKVVDYTK